MPDRRANCGEPIDGLRVRRVVDEELESYGSLICAYMHARKVAAVRAMSSFNPAESSAGHDTLVRLNHQTDAIARRGRRS